MTDSKTVAIDEVAAAAHALARRLASLPEASMRQAVLLEHLEAETSAAAVPVLEQIRVRGRTEGRPFDVSLMALTALLNEGRLPYPLLTALYEAAKATEHDGLCKLFLSAGDPVVPVGRQRDPERELTLGHRKTLARCGDRDTLARLLHDPEAAIMSQLLLNPRLTERDVVRVAARRPIEADISRAVATSERWISRYKVKRALVLNPYTPPDLSLRLLGFLNRQDLREVQSNTSISQVVSEAARRLANQRST